MTEETTLLSTPESEVAEVAANTQVEGKPADAVADVAKETEQAEEETLLGKDEKPKEQASLSPEKYDFKVPEGFELDNTLLDKVTPIFKEIGLSQEQAQKLVDAYAPYVKEQTESKLKQLSDSYKTTVKGWEKETVQKLGPEPQKELAYAAKVINKFSSDPKKFREEVNETGAGNRYYLNELLIKVGKAFGEDKVVQSDKSSQGNSQDVFLRKHYPSMQT